MRSAGPTWPFRPTLGIHIAERSLVCKSLHTPCYRRRDCWLEPDVHWRWVTVHSNGKVRHAFIARTRNAHCRNCICPGCGDQRSHLRTHSPESLSLIAGAITCLSISWFISAREKRRLEATATVPKVAGTGSAVSSAPNPGPILVQQAFMPTQVRSSLRDEVASTVPVMASGEALAMVSGGGVGSEHRRDLYTLPHRPRRRVRVNSANAAKLSISVLGRNSPLNAMSPEQ